MRVARSAAMLVAAAVAALGLASTASAAPCSGYGYLASATGIQRFSTTTNAITNAVTISAASTIVDAALSPDGTRLYAVDQATDRVLAIDTATNAQTATITVGDAPVAVAFSRDGLKAYVANGGDRTLTIIDAATDTVLGATAALGVTPTLVDVEVSASGAAVYVSGRAPDGVYRYSTSGAGSWTTTIAAGADPGALALAPDGATLYVANGTPQTVTTITTATDVVSTTFAVPGQAQAIAVDPTGQTVYVGTSASGAASLVARANGATSSIGAASSAGGVFSITVKPDGNAIAALTASRVDVQSTTGTTLGALTGTALRAVAICPAVAPDAPSAVKTTPGDTAVDVAWTASASDGGAAITAYTATASPGGATCTATGTTCTVTGLRNATAYTFTVTATNAAGTSAASAASAKTTPRKDNRARTLVIGPATVTFTKKGVGVAFQVTATGPGVIAAAMTYKLDRYCTVSRRVTAAGVYRVRCIMAAAGRTLARKRAVSYTLRATFSPTNGPLASAQATVLVPRRR